MAQRFVPGLSVALIIYAALSLVAAQGTPFKTTLSATAPDSTVRSAVDATASPTSPENFGQDNQPAGAHAAPQVDLWSMLFVFVLATFIGIGVIARVSRLLHTPLMSITNAISAIAVVGSIIVTGADYPMEIRILGAIALFASTTNIVSGFLITDRMLKMFKSSRGEEKE